MSSVRTTNGRLPLAIITLSILVVTAKWTAGQGAVRIPGPLTAQVTTSAPGVHGISICTSDQCGDRTRAGTEECDDGNTRNNDGCSAQCKIERGWQCVPLNQSSGGSAAGSQGGTTALQGTTTGGSGSAGGTASQSGTTGGQSAAGGAASSNRSSSPAACTDSDGGDVPTLAGNLQFFIPDALGPTLVTLHEWCGAGGTTLRELVCQTPPTPNGVVGQGTSTCPAGTSCVNAACLTAAQAALQLTSCSDSDGGMDPFTAGQVVAGGQTFQDSCTPGAFIEHYCNGTTHMVQGGNCPTNNCVQGRCIQ